MNLIRYYNQNRKKIKGILIIISSAFILLQLVNLMYKNKNEENLAIRNNTSTEINVNTNATTLTTNESVVTGERVSTNELQSAIGIIDEFISYCNNKELEKAYNLLTDECKEQIYYNLEVFEQAYYNNVFDGKSKNCTVESWINNTYKVKINEDILSTGKSNSGYSKQDYITVKKEEDGYKLNINSYIGYTSIDKLTENDKIRMMVVDKNTYMDYEEYTIKATNLTDSLILLDSMSDAKSLYLQDSRGVTYSSYSNELTEPMLTISSGQTKELKIKFYSSYISTKNIEYIVFSNIISRNGELSEKIEFNANV